MPMPSLPTEALERSSTRAGDWLSGMRPSEKLATTGKLPVFANAPFFLRHLPGVGNWEAGKIGDEVHILPILLCQPLTPGAGGVRTINKGEDIEDAYKNAIRDAVNHEGWIYLEPNAPLDAAHRPAGAPEGGYLRELPALDGTFHLEVWNVPRTKPDGSVEWRFDRESYNRWRLHLVESGRIPEAEDEEVADLRARYDNHVRRKKVLTIDPQVRAELIERAEAVAKPIRTAKVPKLADDAPPKRGRK